eukprot:6846637-Prymnesium_polylepis.2
MGTMHGQDQAEPTLLGRRPPHPAEESAVCIGAHARTGAPPVPVPVPVPSDRQHRQLEQADRQAEAVTVQPEEDGRIAWRGRLGTARGSRVCRERAIDTQAHTRVRSSISSSQQAAVSRQHTAGSRGWH